ncbi:MAG: nuclease [Sulfobacillus acidophilus]|uniref:Nuclease n=1 Tax=Sulfobacillus acidophilus TaxID=53633 RepID=A0A2T2WJB7_9FIRM|nr:MAG: nuclease [Sulfobacillus acidophilus]
MSNSDEPVVLTASDLISFLECEHRTVLTWMARSGQIAPPLTDDPARDMLSRLGQAHEQAVRDRLAQTYGPFSDLAAGFSLDATLEDRRTATLEVLHRGDRVLYHPFLWSAPWMGIPDFLVRVDEPSLLGGYRYDVAEAKLAYHARTSAVIQATVYALLLASLQGVDPTVRLYLGNGTTRLYSMNAASSFVRLSQVRFQHWMENPPTTYPEPVAACDDCTWLALCEERRRADDHLWYVADITRSQIAKLGRVGITTVTALAQTPRVTVPGIGGETLQRLKQQALLQLRGRETDSLITDLLPVVPGRGLALLPPPSPGDMFFDLEGDPLTEDGPLEYLFGWADWTDGKDEPVFHALWAHTPTEERQIFEEFIDRVMARLDRYPAMHIYHYAGYEPAALKRLMGRYGTREVAVDRLLRAGILVDLYQIVRQSLRISSESYSIKALEPLYRQKRAGEVTNAATSIVAYNRWKQTRDARILEAIADYNRDDCLSTWQLSRWLWTLKHDRRVHGAMVDDPKVSAGEAPDAVAADEDQVSRLVADLTAPLPSNSQDWTTDQKAIWLLAQLLQWHRREDRSQWWRYFENLALDDHELLESPETLAGLRLVGFNAYGSLFEYPPQEHKIKAEDRPVNPATKQVVGTVSYVDPASRRIAIRLRSGIAVPHSLIPPKPFDKQVLKDALRDLARSVHQHGMLGPGPYGAMRHLLMRIPPSAPDPVSGYRLRRRGESAADAARRIALTLNHDVLPIQGPPGSGKTFTGAQIIVDLVEAGLRVGITALSHQVITHLVDEVIGRAQSRDVPLAVAQKVSALSQGSQSANVFVEPKAYGVWHRFRDGRVQVVAGTAWLFARSEWHEALDVLVIDEAGQFSLADALAASRAARSIILLGDPQQLRQPTQGHHPPGVDVSVLEYILGPHDTVPDDVGIFLDITYRMHPAITEYISAVAYEGKLRSHDACRRQALHAPPWLQAGLVFVPVAHEGNRTASVEETDAVAVIVESLIGKSWTDQAGTTRALSWADVLVVAPFNAHVSYLKARLPGARVGTVDKFQGQEAPVVIYSMAASRPENVPRGMEFLYSLNRLNVAISRAQGVAVLVANPALLTAKPKDPEQLRLVNALCAFVERARAIPIEGLGDVARQARQHATSSTFSERRAPTVHAEMNQDRFR